MSLILTLAEIPLFREFTPEEFALFDRVLAVREFPDKAVIIREGTQPDRLFDALFVLLEGRVGITCCGARGEGVGDVRELEPGEVFGLVSLVDPGPRSASCIARGAVRVAVMMRNSFEALRHSHPELAERFLLLVARQLARDVRGAVERLRLEIERSE